MGKKTYSAAELVDYMAHHQREYMIRAVESADRRDPIDTNLAYARLHALTLLAEDLGLKLPRPVYRKP